MQAICDGKVSHMINSFDFLKDSLFCEWAYIINLDLMQLEIYSGFNKEAQDGNPLEIEQKPDENGYYPVRFLRSYPVNKIPKNWRKTIEKLSEKSQV